MKIIKLYGELGKKFGKEFRLAVKTPAEAIRALCSQLKGFRQHLEEFSEPGYVVRVGKDARGTEELIDPFSSKEVIRIIPVVAGASSAVKIILGVALIAVAWWNPMAWGAAATLITGGLGVSLALGGVVELLAPAPKTTDTPKSPEQTPSYMFNGPVNTVGPGNAITVGYGTLLLGSLVVSAELYSVEEPINGSSGSGEQKSGVFGGVSRAIYKAIGTVQG